MLTGMPTGMAWRYSAQPGLVPGQCSAWPAGPLALLPLSALGYCRRWPPRPCAPCAPSATAAVSLDPRPAAQSGENLIRTPGPLTFRGAGIKSAPSHSLCARSAGRGGDGSLLEGSSAPPGALSAGKCQSMAGDRFTSQACDLSARPPTRRALCGWATPSRPEQAKLQLEIKIFKKKKFVWKIF